jgi:chromate transport protein ChrA
LPAAIASYGLALGISKVNQQLPDPVYALLSGLNAATVGIIVLAAVQLSQKAITDKITRILVFFGATAGMLYNTLWYFPVLMLVGGLSTVIWDYTWLQNLYRRVRPARRAEQTPDQDVEASESATELTQTTAGAQQPERRRQVSSLHSGEEASRAPNNGSGSVKSKNDNAEIQDNEQERIVPEALQMRIFSWKFGTAIIAAFFVTFAVIMVLRGVLPNRPRGFSLFANLYLAGTIIFGGGPVVIPLLRESVVLKGDLFPLLMAVFDEFSFPDTSLPKAGSLLATFSSVSPSSKPFQDQISTVIFPRSGFIPAVLVHHHQSLTNRSSHSCRLPRHSGRTRHIPSPSRWRRHRLRRHLYPRSSPPYRHNGPLAHPPRLQMGDFVPARCQRLGSRARLHGRFPSLANWVPRW